MKAQILKIAGVKSEKEFYKKYPSEEAFMKVHGKEFKKAQMGVQIDKAQFGGNYNLGQTPNFQTPGAAAGFMPKNNFSMQTPKLNLFNPQGDQSQTKMAQGIFEGAHSVEDSPFSTKGSGPGAEQILGAATGIIDAAGAFKQQRNKLKKLKQQGGVADISLQAAQSTDVDAPRQMQDTFAKNRRSKFQPMTGEKLFPVDGVGTNILSAKNGRMLQGGGEIQNTYDPYDIYTDGGYEPLNDSNVKQYYHGGDIPYAQNGFSSFMGAGGTDFANKAVGKAFGNNAGSQMGTAVGGALKMIPGVGPVVGAVAAPILGAIGGGLDQAFGDAGKIKKEQAGLDRSIAGIKNAGSAKQTTGFLQNIGVGKDGINVHNYEEGGWVSNDWQPQVIASFGGLDEQEVYDYAHEGMDTLRAGGHLRDYTPPSDRAMEIYKNGGDVKSYGLGGELETHWGGGAETLSYNPYLPGTGETVMFRGKSHEEYSPNGETGIGVTYGGNPVEVERGEPMVELEEGGVVDPMTGEVQKSGVVFGNLKIPNQYIDLLGDPNAKDKKFKTYVGVDLYKQEQKGNKLVEQGTSIVNKKDATPLQIKTGEAIIFGGNSILKTAADRKINAASLQNAINETAEENGLVADDLARGKVKIDKEAQKQSAKFGGKFTKAQDGDWYSNHPIGGAEDYGQANMQGGELNEVVIRPKKRFQAEPEERQSYMWGDVPDVSIQPELSSIVNTPEKTKKEKLSNKSDWWDKASLFANTALPYLRPSDQEALDASQLYPEMYAMATNQLEPVQANFYRPELGVPYDISLQDQLNATQADYRAAQRMMGYNPAAQANLNAQKYQANQQVLGEQFRANQAMKDKAYGENRNILNDAKLKNLAIADQQYTRQAEALSNTKATTQAALNSIADKYAKNKLENRTLGVMENMYNYRFDDKGRAVNMNPLVNFKEMIANANPEELEMYKSTLEGKTSKEKDKTKSAKNGSIVKSYKNL